MGKVQPKQSKLRKGQSWKPGGLRGLFQNAMQTKRGQLNLKRSQFKKKADKKEEREKKRKKGKKRKRRKRRVLEREIHELVDLDDVNRRIQEVEEEERRDRKRKERERQEESEKNEMNKNEEYKPFKSDFEKAMQELTDSERRFLERQKMNESYFIKKQSVKTHRQRIEEYNNNLANLSEHHDIPKVGPG